MSTSTIVIDLETMDTCNTAVILSIGAFAFNLSDHKQTKALILEHSDTTPVPGYGISAYYYNVEAFDQLFMGRTVSPKTQEWWSQQADSAKNALIDCQVELHAALKELTNWMQQHPSAQVYFRGPDFDGSILESAFSMCSITCPWHYSAKRDVRTYIDALTGSNRGKLDSYTPCFAITKHNALHDAMCDAEQMTIAYKQPN